jgi:multidrug transporter EmrE-like cation transporter
MTDLEVKDARLTPGAWVLLLVNLALIAGQTGFGKQAALQQAAMTVGRVATNPWYWATMACLGVQALVWPLVLQRVPLGFAYGFNALSYVNTLLLSRFVFREHVSLANLLGAGLIMVGVMVWARGVERQP